MNTFAQKIRRIREEKKLRQSEIAPKLGISRSSYIEIEKGQKELTLTQLKCLASILDLSLEELLLDTSQVAQKDFNLEKYKHMVLNCLEHGGDKRDGKLTKTKLAKLVYLADFTWFYHNLMPMSGLAYRRIQQGPVPDQYFRVIDELFESGTITIDKKNNSNVWLIGLTEKKAPSNKLTKEEIELIKKVGKKWQDKNTQEIVDFTHKQLPWKICRTGELIPYELITQEEPQNVY